MDIKPCLEDDFVAGDALEVFPGSLVPTPGSDTNMYNAFWHPSIPLAAA